jgi:DNA polymerase III sliding clamp (beta) subunit (PCNA family)
MSRFELTIAREVLSAALSRAALAASTKNIIPVMGCVRLEHQSGALRLTTTNMSQTLTLMVPAEIADCRPICLPVKRLLDIVTAIPAGAVSIRGNEASTKAIVSSGRTKLELYGFPSSEFPVVENPQFDGSFGLEAQAFSSVFAQIGVHCSSAESRAQTFGGILLDSREDGLYLVAMDGSAVGARVKFAPAIEPQGSWILPRSAAPAITKLFSTDASLQISVSSVAARLSIDGVHLDLRLIEGPYPNYVYVFNRNDAKSVGAVDAAALKSVIQRINAIGDVRLTVLSWFHDRIEVRAQSDNGVINDEVACRYSGEEGFTFGIVATFISNAIATVNAEDLRFYMTAPNRNVVITDAAKDTIDRDVAIAPLRVLAEPSLIAA